MEEKEEKAKEKIEKIEKRKEKMKVYWKHLKRWIPPVYGIYIVIVLYLFFLGDFLRFTNIERFKDMGYWEILGFAVYWIFIGIWEIIFGILEGITEFQPFLLLAVEILMVGQFILTLFFMGPYRWLMSRVLLLLSFMVILTLMLVLFFFGVKEVKEIMVMIYNCTLFYLLAGGFFSFLVFMGVVLITFIFRPLIKKIISLMGIYDRLVNFRVVRWFKWVDKVALMGLFYLIILMTGIILYPIHLALKHFFGIQLL